MEKHDNKETKLIIKFIRLTIENQIKWKVIDTPNALIDGTDFKIPIFFTTTYNDKVFAVFSRRYKHYLDIDEWNWAEEIKIAILENEKILWENKEQIPAIYDLFNVIQEQVSGIDNIIDSFID